MCCSCSAVGATKRSDSRRGRHSTELRRTEGHPEVLEERTALLVGLCGGDEADVHSLDHVDAVVVDLGEDDLLLEAERVVALAVEGLARNTLEVARARKPERDEAVGEA